MADRRVLSPKVLLSLAAAVLVLSSAIAIYLAVGYTPDSRSHRTPTAPSVTETSELPLRPPEPEG